MTDFKIGDVVRIETDKADSLRLVIRGINYSTSHAFLCVSECGKRIRWSAIEEMELVNRPDPQADLQQAIREVLLSDEFMAAFAAAFMKATSFLELYSEPSEGADNERAKRRR